MRPSLPVIEQSDIIPDDKFDPDTYSAAFVSYHEAIKYGFPVPIKVSYNDKMRFMEVSDNHIYWSMIGGAAGLIGFGALDYHLFAARLYPLGIGLNIAIKIPYYIGGIALGKWLMTRRLVHPRDLYREIYDRRHLVKEEDEISKE